MEIKASGARVGGRVFLLFAFAGYGLYNFIPRLSTYKRLLGCFGPYGMCLGKELTSDWAGLNWGFRILPAKRFQDAGFMFFWPRVP